MTPILSTIYSTFKSSTTPNIISSINTKMSPTIHQCDEMSYIYETTLQKFNNYHEREKSLRKFVLLRNFYTNQFLIPPPIDNNQQQQQEEYNNNNNFVEYFNEKLEWSEDDIKKEEETWLDACLDDASLDEYDDGYVYVIKPNDGDQQIIGEVEGGVVAGEQEKEPIINYKEEIIIPNDLFLEESKINSNINSKISNNNIIINNNNISDQEFHPYWKDNSIIRPKSAPLPPSIDHYRPFFDQKSSSDNVSNSNNNVESNNNSNNNNNNNKTRSNNGSNNSSGNFKIRSFSIPKIFHKYKLGHAILDLLQYDNQPYFFDQSTNTTNNTNRSQDDLDMLFYSPPKDLLDHGMLSDIISMLEWYGGKKNDSSNNNNAINSNNKNTTTTTTECVNTSINANNWFVECEKC